MILLSIPNDIDPKLFQVLYTIAQRAWDQTIPAKGIIMTDVGGTGTICNAQPILDPATNNWTWQFTTLT